MEVIQEQVIEVALNTAGYIVAGAFWLFLYATWQNRRVRATQSSPAPQASVETPAVTLTPAPARPGQFVDLSAVATPTPADSTKSEREPSRGRRRNRAEVFALARKMLETGETHKTIKQSMPISDGELALLTGNK